MNKVYHVSLTRTKKKGFDYFTLWVHRGLDGERENQQVGYYSSSTPNKSHQPLRLARMKKIFNGFMEKK